MYGNNDGGEQHNSFWLSFKENKIMNPETPVKISSKFGLKESTCKPCVIDECSGTLVCMTEKRRVCPSSVPILALIAILLLHLLNLGIDAANFYCLVGAFA